MGAEDDTGEYWADPRRAHNDSAISHRHLSSVLPQCTGVGNVFSASALQRRLLALAGIWICLPAQPRARSLASVGSTRSFFSAGKSLWSRKSPSLDDCNELQ